MNCKLYRVKKREKDKELGIMQKVVKTRRSKMFCGVVWMFRPILSNVASRYPSSYHDRCSYQAHFLLDTHICMSIRFLLMGNVDKDHADIQCLQNSESRLYPKTSQHQENALRVHIASVSDLFDILSSQTPCMHSVFQFLPGASPQRS